MSQYPDQSEFPEYWTPTRKDVGIRGTNYMPGRYYSPRDMRLLHSINSELYGDIIECVVQLFKIAINETPMNIYGESSPESGKSFYNGIDMTCMVEPEEISSDNAERFGPDRSQNIAFKFRERDCIKTNFYPEIGDLVFYNERYYEIDNVVQEQFLLGHPDRSWSIIVNTHYTRLSKLNLVERQQ